MIGESVIGAEQLENLQGLLNSAYDWKAEVWECGVYRGGSALKLLHTMLKWPEHGPLRLFDTFTGIKLADPTKGDTHVNGDFSDTNEQEVRALFWAHTFVNFHVGTFPQTFAGLESSRICFAHVDCDVYHSVMACLEFIWPRLNSGGIIVLDDYRAHTCLGAKKATDEFLSNVEGFSKLFGLFPQLVIRKL